jgi:hypothetical protein
MTVRKPILKFKEDVKAWVIPNCMWMLLESTYGRDSDEWIGQQVELYCDPNVMFGSKRVGGIRCNVPVQRKAPRAAPPRTAAAAPVRSQKPAPRAPEPIFETESEANFNAF